jgi:hemoglobin-like flavoprotein
MTAATDHALMEGSLEALAELTEDLTPFVYARFFARHPETEALFVDELGRGRMLYEIIQTCLELAEDRAYVQGSLASLASDHTSYGEIPILSYQELLEDLLAVMAELLGAGWTTPIEAAWRRQTERMLDHIGGALALQRSASQPAA